MTSVSWPWGVTSSTYCNLKQCTFTVTSNLTFTLPPRGAERLVVHPIPWSYEWLLSRECLYMPVIHRKAYPAPETSYRPTFNIVLHTANEAKYKRSVRADIRWPEYICSITEKQMFESEKANSGRQASQALACSTLSTLIKMRYYTDLCWVLTEISERLPKSFSVRQNTRMFLVRPITDGSVTSPT